MTVEEKKKLLEKEIYEMFLSKAYEEIEMQFPNEIEAHKYDLRWYNKIHKHYNRRIKELGITDLKEKEIYDVE